MTNYLDRISEITQNAIAEIRNRVKNESINLRIHQTDDNDDDLYDLPVILYLGKHGNFEQYRITKVKREDDRILLDAIGENDSDDFCFDIDELQSMDICGLADYLNEFALETA